MARSTVVIATLVALSGCTRGPAIPAIRGYGAEVAEGIHTLRSATRAFHALDSAVAAGYPRIVAACLVHEHHGAMGYHHVNQSYLDAKLDLERPEILLYERRPEGEYRLNGVEFIVPYRSWPRDSIAPVLMGQTLDREDNLKFWYLHVWAWSENPGGIFANFNSKVACLDGTGKVYKPFPETSR